MGSIVSNLYCKKFQTAIFNVSSKNSEKFLLLWFVFIIITGLFLTSATKKTKTQGQNSSKELREKLSLFEPSCSNLKNSRKNSSFGQISRGTPKNTIFINSFCLKMGICLCLFDTLLEFFKIKKFVLETLSKNNNYQGKIFLKEKTQTLGVLILALAPNWYIKKCLNYQLNHTEK